MLPEKATADLSEQAEYVGKPNASENYRCSMSAPQQIGIATRHWP
jgi:hypothetical protein